MSNIVDPKTLAKDFWEDMDATDFKIDRVIVGQKSSKNPSYVKGEFNFMSGSSTPIVKECKLVVPTKGRVLYGGPKGKALCGSDNFMDPSPRFETPVSSSCMECPLKDWDFNEDKSHWAKRLDTPHKPDLEKPLCQESYTMLMATSDWSPFFMSFQKSQIQLIKKQLLSVLRTKWMGTAPFHVAFDMGLKDEGNWYSVTFSNFREASSPEMGTAMYQEWKARAAGAAAKQYEDMDKAKETSGEATKASEPPLPGEGDAPHWDSDEEIPF